MPCGIVQPDGTVTVTLRWTSGSPDPVSERVVAAQFGGDVHEWFSSGSVPANSSRQVAMTGLLPNGNYAWTVQTTYSNGEVKDSAQGSFTTPVVQQRVAATGLSCT